MRMGPGCCKLVQLVDRDATGTGGPPSTRMGMVMRSLLKPNLLLALQQNPAGLIVDLGILALFVLLLVVR